MMGGYISTTLRAMMITMVKSLLPEGITKVIEAHSKVSRDDLLKGIDFLKEKGVLP